MATDKRARQRANREEKRAEQAKIDRRATLLTRIRRGAVWLIAVVIVVALASIVF